ncbi:MAG: helix-turn-helix domain-containing protein [Gemmatales bacterium]
MRYQKALAIPGRLDQLIELIRSGAYSSLTLAKKLKVSEQTVYRDIGHLKENGYEICAKKHSTGWAYHLWAEPATVSSGKGS